VLGDVQAFDNDCGLLIADNVIDGNLQCHGNDPPPTGGNNRVSGNKEDQCANLAPEDASGVPAGNGTSADSGRSAAGGGGVGDGGAIDRGIAGLLLALLTALGLRRSALARTVTGAL
jgi:hypothetical protein